MFRNLLGIKAAEDRFLARFDHSLLVGDEGVNGAVTLSMILRQTILIFPIKTMLILLSY